MALVAREDQPTLCRSAAGVRGARVMRRRASADLGRAAATPGPLLYARRPWEPASRPPPPAPRTLRPPPPATTPAAGDLAGGRSAHLPPSLAAPSPQTLARLVAATGRALLPARRYG